MKSSKTVPLPLCERSSNSVRDQGVIRFDFLTALRGLAAFLVMILHVVGGAAGNPVSGPVAGALRCITDFGAIGVDIFFVISGYCISSSVMSFMSRGRSAWTFLLDRCVRILPVFWVALALAILSSLLIDLMMGRSVPKLVCENGFEWLGHLFLVDVFLGLSPAMDVTWTLSHEFVFYALAGLVIVSARTRGTRYVSFTIILAMVVASMGGWSSGIFLPLRFLPEFMCGILVFIASRRPKLAWPVMASLVALVAIYWFGARLHDTNHAHLQVFRFGELPARMSAAALFACLLILVQPNDGWISRQTLVRPFSFLGTISFSLYLIHVPASQPVINGLARILPIHALSGVFLIIISIMVALISGWLLNKWVEIPIEAWRRSRLSK